MDRRAHSYDRMYLINHSRPIHVSFSKSRTRQVVRLLLSKDGRYFPRVENWNIE